MAFMRPEVTDEDFLTVETNIGTSHIPCDVTGTLGLVPGERTERTDAGCPEALLDVREYVDGRPEAVTLVRGKWFARLSAPGYLDSTDWAGPFDSEQAARDDIADVWDVCGSCGEDMGTREGTYCGACDPDDV